ncbi:MAG: hemerythrin domain-containing protein [Pseudomonadota bacterium]
MTILDLLKTDHDHVKAILKEILGTDDVKQRGELFKQFKTDMTAHSRAEEKVLYLAMEKADEEAKDEALEGFVEHEIVDRLMDDLSRSRAKDSDKWTARCKVLKELIEHHVEEEEGEFFATARKLFDVAKLERMGEAFLEEKPKHEGHGAHHRAAE